MNIFNYDGGIMRAINKFTDCIFLSILFLISCIPVFTIGTAATSLYYTAYKVLRCDRGYVFRDYVESFRDNFKQTAPVWLLVLVFGSVLGADWSIMMQFAQNENILSILTAVFMIGITVLTAWTCYLFPFMARFENTRKQSMKNAILMVVAHLPMTILMLVLLAAVLFLLYMAPPLILFLPAVYAWIQSFILERIFRRYMTEEERAKEEERDKKFLG